MVEKNSNTLPEYYEILLDIQEGFGKPLVEVEEPPEYIEILDEYWIVPGFSMTQIWGNNETYKVEYVLFEPAVAENELELMNVLYNDIKRSLVLKEISLDVKAKMRVVLETLKILIDEYALEIDDELTLKILYYLFRNFLGYGAIDSLLSDPYIEDISCDGYDIPVYVFHTKHGGLPTNVKFAKEELDSLVLLLCQKSGKYISYANPLVDATLPDGSRLQASYGSEITPRGSSFTIRKFRAEPFTPIDLMEFGTMNSTILAYFWLLVENKMSFMVVGETAAGKTTTMNALMMFIPPEAKVVSIEDIREIQLSHENWIAGVTRVGVEGKEISMYDLLRSALRQRPDYIIVGEVRGKEAQTLFQAMSTGHASYSTLHAGDINQLVYRLENEPLNVPRIMIQFLDAVIVQTMWAKKGVRKRRAKEISEIFGIDPVNRNLLVNPLFKWEPTTDSFSQLSDSKKLEKIAQTIGEDVDFVIEELQRRKEYLEIIHRKGIKGHENVIRLIHAYYRNPEKALEEVNHEGGNKSICSQLSGSLL